MEIKSREEGRVVNVTAVMAIAVNADGHWEILGIEVVTCEDGAGCSPSCTISSAAACEASSWSSRTLILA